MKIYLQSVHAINHIGGRENNEDSIFPPLGTASKNNTLFMVNDGVGGNAKGEVASKLACDTFADCFANKNSDPSNEAYIDEALKATEEAFDKYIANNEQAKGMGTTLTLAHFHTEGVTIAHIGDSRVYQIRRGQIIFQTDDHSLVNDLLKGGLITEEQAKEDPRKNVISRAIQGTSVKPTKADVTLITNIQAGDYFFLCSDGILENISDFEIAQILILDKSNEEKMQQIQQRCEESPNDNFSAYLIQIDTVEGAPVIVEDEEYVEAEVESVEEEVFIEAEVDDVPAPAIKKPTSKKKFGLFFLFLIVILVPAIWFMSGNGDNKDDIKQSAAEEIGIQNPTNTEDPIANEVPAEPKDTSDQKPPPETTPTQDAVNQTENENAN